MYEINIYNDVAGIYYCYSESYKVGISMLKEHLLDKIPWANNFKTCLYYLIKQDLL